MLKRSFILISGVGAKRELAIWRAGVESWEDFIQKGQALLPRSVFNLGLPVVKRSLQALAAPNGLAVLAGMLPSAEHWRFWPQYNRVAYLDIETGGDPGEWGGITMVGIYDGETVQQYVAGDNIHELDQAMRGYDIVCTFAGSTFDIPVLKSVFNNLYVPPVHIDLRWVLKRVGYNGGLKRIEKTLGIQRPDEVDGLSGLDAVRLWAEHQTGDEAALATLKQYNAWDVLSLKPLLEIAVNQLKERILGRLG